MIVLPISLVIGSRRAFSKKVWQDVGGFDDSLTLSGEDTKFFYSALEKGFKIKRVKNALVDWVEPEHFGFKDFKKFYYYAKGDAQAGIWWHPVQKWRRLPPRRQR